MLGRKFTQSLVAMKNLGYVIFGFLIAIPVVVVAQPPYSDIASNQRVDATKLLGHFNDLNGRIATLSGSAPRMVPVPSAAPLVQAGSFVCTAQQVPGIPGVFGCPKFLFPQAFPNGLWSVVLTNGNMQAAKVNIFSGGSENNKQDRLGFVPWISGALEPIPVGGSSFPVQINYVAFGW